MSTFRAAKTICDLKGWRVSNLPLQKLLYLSHLIHLGTVGEPLVSREFEAWNLGPVEPDLYHKLKAYGAHQIEDIFGVPAYEPGSPERNSIEKVMRDVGTASAAKLVAITHWKGGAWALHYRPNIQGIRIPHAAVAEEYQRIVANQSSARSAAAS